MLNQCTMNKLHSFATSRTHVLTIDVLSPITYIATAIVIQSGFALEYFVLATVAKMIRRTVVWVRIELRFLVRTLDSAVHDSSFGRDEHGRERSLLRHHYGGHFGRGRRCRTNGFSWPHARLVRLRIPESIAAFEDTMQARQAIVVYVAMVRVWVVTIRVPFN